LTRYEIWWAELPAPAGKRPVLLLSRPDSYEYLNKFVAAEITTTARSIPVEVPLGPAEGLARKCVVNCDNLRTVSRSALVKRAGLLGRRREVEVKRAIGYALAWDELIDAKA
jgi:mRNA-degrading endonuclease toxin of MazEF toxin-antitoxin module